MNEPPPEVAPPSHGQAAELSHPRTGKHWPLTPSSGQEDTPLKRGRGKDHRSRRVGTQNWPVLSKGVWAEGQQCLLLSQSLCGFPQKSPVNT